MISALRLFLVALMLLTASGCGKVIGDAFRGIFGPPQPAVQRYRLATPSLGDGPDGRGSRLPGSIAIAPYVTRGIYDRANIAFRVDDVRLETYPAREWAIPLRHMLGQITQAVMNAQPLTTGPAAFDPRSLRSYDYQWRGTVVEFEEVNRGLEVLAAVHLEAQLVRSANDSVVWSGAERMERAVPAPTDSMSKVVETLSGLAAEVVERLVERARTGVTIPTAAAAPPPR